MRTCLYSLTIHFLLTEELRHVVPLGLSLQCVRTHPQLPCRPAWWGEPWEPWASNHRRMAGRDNKRVQKGERANGKSPAHFFSRYLPLYTWRACKTFHRGSKAFLIRLKVVRIRDPIRNTRWSVWLLRLDLMISSVTANLILAFTISFYLPVVYCASIQSTIDWVDFCTRNGSLNVS